MSFIGQHQAQSRIMAWIDADFKTNVLFRGFAGSGKTTLAKIYASAISGGDYFYHLCSSRNSRPKPPSDRAVVILDEIHNLKNEEEWYEFPGVLIGCTTEGAPISEPFMTRMTEIWLTDYTLDELTQIVIVKTGLDEIGACAVAQRSRGCPRVAIRLAEELKALGSGRRRSMQHYRSQLENMGIMAGGFTQNDVKYIQTLKRLGGTASLSTICAALNMSRATVTEEIEPFLLKKSLITVTSKGRSLVI